MDILLEEFEVSSVVIYAMKVKSAILLMIDDATTLNMVFCGRDCASPWMIIGAIVISTAPARPLVDIV